ncbi:MAG TPA: NAD-dependent epimerase/dehydratase family protein [Gaiellaceae bacterium]|nr:NAD-dependent epimerase/dehydratase family protein [Gaiellaceae bacterium]
MRVLVAGATGVIGRPLVPLLLERGHVVAGLTRSQGELVRALGAEPIVCDVYDLPRLRELVGAFAPDVVVHLLTDLPDEHAKLPEYRERNARIRREGTRNLLAAAPGARFVAQSVAFDAGPAVADLERMIPDFIRLPALCGPGTYDPGCGGEGERMHVDEAARLFANAVG